GRQPFDVRVEADAGGRTRRPDPLGQAGAEAHSAVPAGAFRSMRTSYLGSGGGSALASLAFSGSPSGASGISNVMALKRRATQRATAWLWIFDFSWMTMSP